MPSEASSSFAVSEPTPSIPSSIESATAKADPVAVTAAAQQNDLQQEDKQTLDFLRDTTLNLGLDTYYDYNFNNPVGRVNLLRSYDVLSNEFSLNQASVIFDHPADQDNGRRWGGRLDLQFGQATDTRRAIHQTSQGRTFIGTGTWAVCNTRRERHYGRFREVEQFARNWGNYSRESSAPSHTDGGAAYVRYQFTAKFATGSRAEYMSDRGGLFGGISQALKENTVTFDYNVAPGFLM
jgi:hypothetical protein